MAEDKLVPVRFTQKQSPFNAGEVAGFTAEIAKKYIDGGVAVYYHADESVTLSVEETIPAEKQLSQEEQAAAKATAEKQLAAAPSEGEAQPSNAQEDSSGPEKEAESAAPGSRRKR